MGEPGQDGRDHHSSGSSGCGNPDVSRGPVEQTPQILDRAGDLLDRRAKTGEQPLAGLCRRDTSVLRASNWMRRRSSRRRIVWLSADGDTPSRAAARVKLRSSATTANAARLPSLPDPFLIIYQYYILIIPIYRGYPRAQN